MNNYAKKLDNLDEVDEFLQTYHLSTLNYEEIENLSRSIKSNKIELVIKSFPHRKAQTRGLHWWILPKIQRRKKKKTNSPPKYWRATGNTFQLILRPASPSYQTHKKTLPENYWSVSLMSIK